MSSMRALAAGAPVIQVRAKVARPIGSCCALAEAVVDALPPGRGDLPDRRPGRRGPGRRRRRRAPGDDDLPVAVARRLLGPDADHRRHRPGPRGGAGPGRGGRRLPGRRAAYATTTKAGLPDPLGPDARSGPSPPRSTSRSSPSPASRSTGCPRCWPPGVHGVAVVGAVSRGRGPEQRHGRPARPIELIAMAESRARTIDGGMDVSVDVVVVGGGAIGLASAWRLAQAGLAVTVCDPAPGSQATHASAGHARPRHRGPLRRGPPPAAQPRRRRSAGPSSPPSWRPSPASRSATARAARCVVALDADDARRARGPGRLPRPPRPRRRAAQRVRQPGGRAERWPPGVRRGLRVTGDHQADNRLLATPCWPRWTAAASTVVEPGRGADRRGRRRRRRA